MAVLTHCQGRPVSFRDIYQGEMSRDRVPRWGAGGFPTQEVTTDESNL